MRLWPLSEIHSPLFEETDMRMAEAVGFGFDLPQNPSHKTVAAPIAPRIEIDALEDEAVNARC
jgi:hypothetical protein